MDLTFEQASAIDFKGCDVFEAVRMSVTLKVIEIPQISAVAKDGNELLNNSYKYSFTILLDK